LAAGAVGPGASNIDPAMGLGFLEKGALLSFGVVSGSVSLN
jgi:hypothetical protein